MSTIAEKLTLLHRTKTDIKAAIETKGQTVGNVIFSQYANKVRAIKGLSPVTPPSASTADVTGKLNCLNGTKADIKTAIEACGVPVGSIPFSQYADKIRAIQTWPTYELMPDYEWQSGYGDVLWGVQGEEYVSDRIYVIDNRLTYETDDDDVVLMFKKIERKEINSSGGSIIGPALNYRDFEFSFDASYEYNCGVDTGETSSAKRFYIAFRKDDIQVPMQWNGVIWITDKNTGAKIKIIVELIN